MTDLDFYVIHPDNVAYRYDSSGNLIHTYKKGLGRDEAFWDLYPAIASQPETRIYDIRGIHHTSFQEYVARLAYKAAETSFNFKPEEMYGDGKSLSSVLYAVWHHGRQDVIDSEKCNTFKNWETWTIWLEFFAPIDSLDYFFEGKKFYRLYDMQEFLKDYVKEFMEPELEKMSDLSANLVTAALDTVDWYELANQFLDYINPEEEDNEEERTSADEWYEDFSDSQRQLVQFIDETPELLALLQIEYDQHRYVFSDTFRKLLEGTKWEHAPWSDVHDYYNARFDEAAEEKGI